jgi:HTH-type transcriptional regulator/antitoxin HigA
MSVTIIYGANYDMENDALVGKTVSEMRGLLSGLLNIPTSATPKVNGESVDANYVLKDGDKLEFVRPGGQKEFTCDMASEEQGGRFSLNCLELAHRAAPLTNDVASMKPLLAIRSEPEYDESVVRLNALVDEVGDNPQDPRYRLIETLSILIEAYDRDHYGFPEASGIEVLRFLMEEHGLTQKDLPEIGSQGVVSEILSGERTLNVRQIRALALRFGVEPGVFLDTTSDVSRTRQKHASSRKKSLRK